jgi:hypothetical protein
LEIVAGPAVELKPSAVHLCKSLFAYGHPAPRCLKGLTVRLSQHFGQIAIVRACLAQFAIRFLRRPM